MVDPPAWQRRFTAPQVGFPAWSDSAPDHLAFVSNESGIWQAWSVDRASGRRRRVTDESVGVEEVVVAPDGRVVWWQDDVGDETGRWVSATPDGSDAHPLANDLPTGWRQGISFAATGAIALGINTEEDYRVYVIPPGGAPSLLRSSQAPIGVGRLDPAGVGGISADGALICLRHSEHGDIIHEALRVVDASGETVGEQIDDGLEPRSRRVEPGAGRRRLLFTSERGPFQRPALWDLATGDRRDLDVDLPGAVIPLGWWPDGSSILARHEFEGTDQLVRVVPDSGEAALVWEAEGEILGAAVRPDGSVWLLNERPFAGSVGDLGRRTDRARSRRRPGSSRPTAVPVLVRGTDRSAGPGVRRDARR